MNNATIGTANGTTSQSEIEKMSNYRAQAAVELAFSSYVETQTQTLELVKLVSEMNEAKEKEQAHEMACRNLGWTKVQTKFSSERIQKPKFCTI